MTFRRVDGEWREEPDEVARCACGELLRRCCEDCLRRSCPACEDGRIDWREASTWTAEAAEGQATLDSIGGETA